MENEEMHQPEVPAFASGEGVRRGRPLTILIVVAVILVLGIIWIGNWAINQQATPSPSDELTDAEKKQILDSLRLPPNTPPMTQAEKDLILRSLQIPPNTPSLTDAQKAEIMNSLK